jgi:hypothetical protein
VSVAAVVAVGTLGLTACGDQHEPTFAEVVCPAVVDWSVDLTRSANAFTVASPTLTSSAARRARYEAAFEETIARTESLHDAVDGAPRLHRADGELIQAELLEAVAQARFELADDLDRARALDDEDYEELAVSNGRLFTGVEKTFAIMLHALNDIGEERDEPTLLGDCGHPAFETDIGISG